MPEPHTAADNVSRVARLGKMDVEDSQTETMPGLQAIHDLGSEDNESKGGKAMTDRAELIARLENIAAGMAQCDWGTDVDMVKEAIAALESKPAKPLPESVEEWIHAHTVEYDNRDWTEQSVPVHHLRRYLAEMHSQHQAELAAKDAEILALNQVISSCAAVAAARQHRIQEAARATADRRHSCKAWL